jgi:phage terminase large subunit-like protein
LKREDLRHRAWHDFWTFTAEVIGNPVLYEPLHHPIADWLMPQNWLTRKKMILMSRGHVKSNLCTIAYCLWRIVRDQNVRILIGSHKDEDGEKFVGAMEAVIEHHDVFRDTFPEIYYRVANNGKPKLANSTEFLVERSASYVEPTVQACSPRSSVTGRHYDVFIGDDLVNERSITGPELLDRTKEFHELCESLLDPGADELIIGTRYHYEDEYGRIIDTRDIRDQYDIKIVPATNTPGIVVEFQDGSRIWRDGDDEKYLNFPSRFTLAKQDWLSPDGDKSKNKKSLVAVRINQGTLVYANQYDLEPRDPDSQCFDVDNIQAVTGLPPGKYTCYQFLDHASEKVTQSKSAIVTTMVNDMFDIYITDVFWGTYSNRQVAEELVRWQDMEVKPFMVGVENGPYEIGLKAYVRERQRELGCWIPFKTITGQQHNTNKDDHIRKLTPFVEAGKVRILAGCRNKNQILDEFNKFPKTAAKDCIDALAQIIDLVLPGKGLDFIDHHPVNRKERPKGYTLNDLILHMDRKAGIRRKYSQRKVRVS